MNDEKYLKRIEDAMHNPGDFALCQYAPILAMFLKAFRPVVPARDCEENLTSQEIADALEPIVHIELEDITDMMLYLGYEIVYVSLDLVTWSMEYVGDGSDSKE